MTRRVREALYAQQMISCKIIITALPVTAKIRKENSSENASKYEHFYQDYPQIHIFLLLRIRQQCLILCYLYVRYI